MKQIKLSEDKFAQVDDAMFDELNQYKWTAKKYKNTWYAERKIHVFLSWKSVYMHRSIINIPDGMQVDHIDLNGLNNTRNNLRVCTHAENSRNRPASSNSTSGYKGVSFCKQRNKFEAKISVNGKTIHLGRFATKEEAARAYDEAAKKHFKEFAWKNF